MCGEMSCNSLPDCLEREAEAVFEPADFSWPALVRGIRVYAVQQPPQVASDLLQFADVVEGMSELPRS
jgi:hypothetical protein